MKEQRPVTSPPDTALQVTDATAPACRPERLGAHVCGAGIDVVVVAPHARQVWLCLLDDDGRDLRERRISLQAGAHGTWHAHVDGVGAGQRYGFRAAGPWHTDHGMRYNPAKLLLDPYARGLSGQVVTRPEIFGHPVDDELRPLPVEGPDERDSARFVAHGVVMATRDPVDPGSRPRHPWSTTVIYEAHVRGLTARLPGVPEHLRGTYAGLAHPATIAHLHRIGVTTLELLPIQASLTEPALTRRGMSNYWGYNTLAYFAPEPRYATAAARAAGPGAVVDEVAGMVHLLHEAGIEVLLDVVLNHTCEGGLDGPTLSWRGLDDAGYYLHQGSSPVRYLDVTGCGNALDFRRPRVVQMALDSLRYWVEQIGVDGFRFDLATTLARRGDQVDMSHPFLVALGTDPVLSGTKLVAEPWDVGPDGWQTGRFPAPLAEWNDRFRDCVRTFWLTDGAAIAAGGTGGDLRQLATRLAGSADLFAHTDVPGGRGPGASINYVTAHDGFTLADLVSYDAKHNDTNGEDNRDGSDDNRSWNHGVEGATDDPEVLAARRRSVRNLVATLLLASGTPMLTAGDEIGRTQRGNNNAYCLPVDDDGDRLALDWTRAPAADDLLATVATLTRLRREHPALRPARFREPGESRGGQPTLSWYDDDAEPMTVDYWHDPHRRLLQMFRAAPEPDARDVLVVINGAGVDVDVTLPRPERSFELVWDSVWERPPERLEEVKSVGGSVTTVTAMSIRLYLADAAAVHDSTEQVWDEPATR